MPSFHFIKSSRPFSTVVRLSVVFLSPAPRSTLNPSTASGRGASFYVLNNSTSQRCFQLRSRHRSLVTLIRLQCCSPSLKVVVSSGLLGGCISPDRKLPSAKPEPPCISGQLKKDLGLEVTSARHAARLVIFAIIKFLFFGSITPVPNGTTQDRRTPLPVRGAIARGAGKRAVDTLLINSSRRGLPRPCSSRNHPLAGSSRSCLRFQC